MPEAAKVQTAKAVQRAAAKRATYDALCSKKPKQREFTIELDEPMTLLFQSIGAVEYDKLLSKHPPTREQLAEGGQFNTNTFAPALLARVCVEPKMDQSEWGEVWNSPDWNRGEVTELFWSAVDLCNKGVDLTPTEAG